MTAAERPSEADVLADLVTRLRGMAAQEFDERGPRDARGAAIWDVAAWIDEVYAVERAQRAVIDGLRSAARDLRAALAPTPREEDR